MHYSASHGLRKNDDDWAFKHEKYVLKQLKTLVSHQSTCMSCFDVLDKEIASIQQQLKEHNIKVDESDEVALFILALFIILALF